MTSPQHARRRVRIGPRFAVRGADIGRRLDTFLAIAVAAVLGNRVFLVVTGYPQVGNGTLHISHAIWGALMMSVALICASSFLGPFTRTFVAFLGGAGFGWFIDELGKFITKDVNYFFEPTFALIYMTFITMYLIFRSLSSRQFGPEEGMLNALEALKSAALGQLDEPGRREVLALFDRTQPTGPLAASVRSLLVDVPALPPHDPSRFARFTARLRKRYLVITSHPKFPTVVDAVFIGIAAVAVVDVFAVGLDGRGIVTFAERATVITSLISAALIVIGAFMLHRSRVEAYQWFDRGLLVQIFVVQIFVFAQESLHGTIGLAVTLTAWGLLRGAMRAERERTVMHDPPPAAAT